MIVTFPHLGPLYIAAAQFLSYLGIPFVAAPANGQKALMIGSSISPEEICLPFKYMAGNLAEAYEMGADTAIMIATGGPCRLGEYGELLKDVLDKAGYHYDWILIDSPSSAGLKEVLNRLGRLTSRSHASAAGKLKGLKKSISLIKKMDRLRSSLQEKAGYLVEPNEAVRLFKNTEEELQRARSFEECFSIIKAAERKLAGFAYKKKADPVKILIAGEIYTSIEPEANGRIEEKLMSMGCSVRRHIDISWWIRYTAFASIVPEKARRRFAAKEGISSNVGGYGRETAARIIRDKWCDGIIKIMPAGCMPEIVTKAYCEAVQDKNGLRILHLIFDEMSGQAGYETRIEAFIDMLERRRDVLAGDRHRIDKYRSGFDG